MFPEERDKDSIQTEQLLIFLDSIFQVWVFKTKYPTHIILTIFFYVTV